MNIPIESSHLPSSLQQEQAPLEEMPITKHLVALRQHLFKVVGLLLVLFFCLLPFANHTYQLMSEPLRAQLPIS